MPKASHSFTTIRSRVETLTMPDEHLTCLVGTWPNSPVLKTTQSSVISMSEQKMRSM
jgi:predicted component of type VI protein secretion system